MNRSEAWALSKADSGSYCRWSDEGCGAAVTRFGGWNWCLLHGTEEYVAALWSAITDATALLRAAS